MRCVPQCWPCVYRGQAEPSPTALTETERSGEARQLPPRLMTRPGRPSPSSAPNHVWRWTAWRSKPTRRRLRPTWWRAEDKSLRHLADHHRFQATVRGIAPSAQWAAYAYTSHIIVSYCAPVIRRNRQPCQLPSAIEDATRKRTPAVWPQLPGR